MPPAHPCAITGCTALAPLGFGAPARWVLARDGAREVRRPVQDAEPLWACGAHAGEVVGMDRRRRGRSLETHRDVSEAQETATILKRPEAAPAQGSLL